MEVEYYLLFMNTQTIILTVMPEYGPGFNFLQHGQKGYQKKDQKPDFHYSQATEFRKMIFEIE